MYRFLLRPAWLGRLAAVLAVAAVMVLLGGWQLDRYEQRSTINERIDSAHVDHAVPLTDVLPPPAGAPVGPAGPEAAEWSMVTATGGYRPEHEILIRGRTVNGAVGFEVLTPLVRADGSAVLINRGWVPPAGTGAGDRPEIPPAPTGEVTVTGRVRPSESGSRPVERLDGVLQTRRIHLPTLAEQMPYPLYHGYLLLEHQQPPGEPGLTAIPVRHENAWLNAGYAAQWWIFAGLVIVGFGWLARREAHGPRREAHGHSERTRVSPEPEIRAESGGSSGTPA